MKTIFDCIPCLLNQTISTVRSIASNETVNEKVLRKVLQLISEMNLEELDQLWELSKTILDD